jgi:hypothetical protein
MRHRVIMFLMDGKPHRFGDFLGYLIKNIDPKLAVRKFLQTNRASREGKQTTYPLEQQIRQGSKTIIRECIRALVEEELIVVLPRDSENWKTEDDQFELTELGKVWLEIDNQGSHPISVIFNELRRLYKNKQLDLSFTIKNTAGTF